MIAGLIQFFTGISTLVLFYLIGERVGKEKVKIEFYDMAKESKEAKEQKANFD
jgi:hypothetical protein